MRYIFVAIVCLVALGFAQPRVSSETGLTRLVFSLPEEALFLLLRQGSEVAIRFQGTPSRSLHTLLNTPQVVVAQRLMSDLLAQANLKFSEQLALKTLRAMVRETGAVSRGVQTAPFYVIRNARIPAILVEIGFVNHPTEGQKLGTSTYRAQLANGLAEGIIAFLNSGNAQR